MEMNNLEEQANNVKAREIFWKPLNVKYAAGRNAESWAATPTRRVAGSLIIPAGT